MGKVLIQEIIDNSGNWTLKVFAVRRIVGEFQFSHSRSVEPYCILCKVPVVLYLSEAHETDIGTISFEYFQMNWFVVPYA